LSRRRVLQVGGGLVVVFAGGTLFRAYDQGVLSTGQGPAYDAWREWDVPTGSLPLNIARAAVLAASAHNSQPWLFHLSSNRIGVYAVPSRNLGTIDPVLREMYLSLGCALENVSLAAAANGLMATVQLMPDATDATFAAQVDLAPAERTVSPLYEAIPRRHTNRAAYADRPMAAETLQSIASLINVPEVALVWFTTPAAKGAFAELTLQATNDFIADPEQSADDFAWFRNSWSELQARKDGLTLDAQGLSPLVRVAGKLSSVSRDQANQGWLTSTRDIQLPTAAAFGILVVPDARDNVQRIQAGRMWQRLQLWATSQGLAMQPLNQVVERAEREQSAGLEPRTAQALASLVPQPAWQAVMPFRVGYPTEQTLASPRLPADEVVGR
jgi:hypothetical protein